MRQMESKLQFTIWKTCLILAPGLVAAAQFFWKDGMLTTTAGVLQVLSFTCWILAFQGMFHPLKTDMPRYAAIGFALAVYGCIGGNNFGVDGIYDQAMGLESLEASGQLLQQMGSSTLVFLFIPGGLFPLSLLVLSILLWRTKKISPLAGLLLFLGAVCFPLSRIPRIDLLAHLDNVLLLAAHILIAVELFGQRRPATRLAAN